MTPYGPPLTEDELIFGYRNTAPAYEMGEREESRTEIIVELSKAASTIAYTASRGSRAVPYSQSGAASHLGVRTR
jgi:hypothetical protein